MAETSIIFMGSVYKSTRYVVSRECTTGAASYETGQFQWVDVDNSLPKLYYDSNSGYLTTMKLGGKPVDITTPVLHNTEYNDQSQYTHSIWVVPDGEWHTNKCPESLATL